MNLERIESIIASDGAFWDYVSATSLDGGTLDLMDAVNTLDGEGLTDYEVLDLVGKILTMRSSYIARRSSYIAREGE